MPGVLLAGRAVASADLAQLATRAEQLDDLGVGVDLELGVAADLVLKQLRGAQLRIAFDDADEVGEVGQEQALIEAGVGDLPPPFVPLPKPESTDGVGLRGL